MPGFGGGCANAAELPQLWYPLLEVVSRTV
jgi:hypothetical protein